MKVHLDRSGLRFEGENKDERYILGDIFAALPQELQLSLVVPQIVPGRTIDNKEYVTVAKQRAEESSQRFQCLETYWAAFLREHPELDDSGGN